MMKITITHGTGEGPTSLAAFDQALLNAGVANYNLIYLSSIIPPGASIQRSRYVTPPDEYGHRLYVVMSCQHQNQAGRSAWAGVGWTQNPVDGRGLFVELHGSNQAQVESEIHCTLETMIASRGEYGPIQSEIIGRECQGNPVCALVIAVYKSEGWDD